MKAVTPLRYVTALQNLAEGSSALGTVEQLLIDCYNPRIEEFQHDSAASGV
jgi:hypothetical protein